MVVTIATAYQKAKSRLSCLLRSVVKTHSLIGTLSGGCQWEFLVCGDEVNLASAENPRSSDLVSLNLVGRGTIKHNAKFTSRTNSYFILKINVCLIKLAVGKLQWVGRSWPRTT